MGDGFAQIFSQIVSIRVKKLSNTNYIASRHITREKSPLPVDVRCSKTSLLKLPIVVIQKFCYHGNVTTHFSSLLAEPFLGSVDNPKYLPREFSLLSFKPTRTGYESFIMP